LIQLLSNLYIVHSYYIRLMPKKDVAVIQLRIATRERLKEIGKKEESYDDIINRILDERDNSGVRSSHD
jgi:hypothetical protein